LAKGRHHLAEIRRTLHLALPVIIGQLAVFSMNFVDTVMSGRLPNRDVALAGLGIGGAVWSAMLMFVLGTLMVVQPSVAQLNGALRKREAASQTRQALWIAVALSFRSSGSATSVSRCSKAFRSIRSSPTGRPTVRWPGAPRPLPGAAAALQRGHRAHAADDDLWRDRRIAQHPFELRVDVRQAGPAGVGHGRCGIATSIVIWLQFLMLFVYIRTTATMSPSTDVAPRRPHWAKSEAC
jgi:MATE family multidrug resistance protein